MGGGLPFRNKKFVIWSGKFQKKKICGNSSRIVLKIFDKEKEKTIPDVFNFISLCSVGFDLLISRSSFVM